jgi:hypothetical protein
MYDNAVLMDICGPKMERIVGDWRKLHSEELYDLHYSPNANRVIK